MWYFDFATQTRKYITLSASTLSNQNNRILNRIDHMLNNCCMCSSFVAANLFHDIYHLWLVIIHQRYIESQFIGNWIELHTIFCSWRSKFSFITILIIPFMCELALIFICIIFNVSFFFLSDFTIRFVNSEQWNGHSNHRYHLRMSVCLAIYL